MDCPQSPPPSDAPSHPYPSPRSKSPPPGPSSKLFHKLPSLRYPLSEITDISFAQAASEIITTPRMGGSESSDVLGQDVGGQYSTAMAPTRDLATQDSENVLRSPIPLFSISPRSPSRASLSLHSPLFEPAPSPNSISLPLSDAASLPFRGYSTSDTATHARKWTKRRHLFNLRSPPPSPNMHCVRKRRPPPLPHLSPPPPPQRQLPALLPPPKTPPPPPPSLSTPAEPRTVQGRKTRTKRELAELQWLVQLYRSLAWQVLTRRAPPSLESGGLMITFETTPRETHWTDALDKRLVTLLWAKLAARGCKPAGNVPPRPLAPPPPAAGIPFPSLAPPIELVKPPTTVPRRPRVSALAFPQPPVAAARRVPVDMPATPPKGMLTPAQLVAQAMLRRTLARAKPIRRGRAPRERPPSSMLAVAE